MSTLPDLPSIDGDLDLLLDVFTHKSASNNPGIKEGTVHGDTDRLAELGAKILDVTVTYHLFSQRPYQSAEELKNNKEQLLNPMTIDSWLMSYGLKSRLRIAPEQVDVVLTNESELAKFFSVYVGAAYLRHGLPVIQAWISRLVDPTGNPPELPGPPAQPREPPPPSHYGHQSAYSSPASSQSYGSYAQSPPASHYAPTPPAGSPPPLPSNPPPPMPSVHMVSNLVTLALVNQTAAQQRIQVAYPAHQDGPPHQPTWTVRCTMNGVEKGIGVGKSQKLAKEEAARQAWAAMGWGPTL